MSEQVLCDTHQHENVQLNSTEIPLNMKTWKTKFSLKTTHTPRHMYVLTKREVYIHLPKHNWVHNKDLHEKQMTQGVYMYILRFGKIDIYMKWKHMIIKICPKMGNTS